MKTYNISEHNDNFQEIAITKDEMVFGRNPKSDIYLDYPQISWHHARLISKADLFFLEDLKSTNGTFVNGQRITRCKIIPEDIISLGSFAFRLTEQGKLVKKDFRKNIRIDADEITVKAKDKILLDKVSFTVNPYEFVGLMGPSGAGKTTLLLALNGYLRPKSGFSLINGKSLYENYDLFRGCIGYVPQDDIIHSELTVYEALYYTAKLRLPGDTGEEEISERINSVLTQLGLLNPDKKIDIRNVIIGSPEKKGISGGQRKRVNLAMEMLTDPSLLFLDEPTSGLSSQDTLIVMDVLRKLADQGKTIILTIHQPSLDAYKKMDNVIILSSGKLMYYGPAYPDSLIFFSPDLPADNADNALKGLAENTEKYWQTKYRNSDYFKTYTEERRKQECKIDHTEREDDNASDSLSIRQWHILTKRYLAVKRKDVMNTAILFLQAPVIAFLIAFVFHGDKTLIPTALFLLVIASLWFGISNSVREIVAEKAIYERERMVNLKIPSYVFSKYAVSGALCLVQCMILVVIVHPVLELKGNFFMTYGVTFLASLTGLSIGLFFSSVAKTQQQAMAILPIILIPMIILGGGMRHVRDMNTDTRILSSFFPSRWAYEQIIHVEQSGEDKVISDSKVNKTEYFFGRYKKSNGILLGVMLGFIAEFTGLTMIVLKLKDRV